MTLFDEYKEMEAKLMNDVVISIDEKKYLKEQLWEHYNEVLINQSNNQEKEHLDQSIIPEINSNNLFDNIVVDGTHNNVDLENPPSPSTTSEKPNEAEQNA